jgi:hypothetical protein
VRLPLNAIAMRHRTDILGRDACDAEHAMATTAQAEDTGPLEAFDAAHEASSDEAAGKPGL